MDIKEALYRIWCGANSGMHTLRDNSAFVNPAGQLSRRAKTRMDGVGIVFEFYTGPLTLSLRRNYFVDARKNHGYGYTNW